VQIADHQRTNLVPETGNLTFYQRPLVNSGRGEYSIASMFWQLFNRTAPDGSPFLHVRCAALLRSPSPDPCMQRIACMHA
jgi:hypothetical protein